MKRYQVKKRYIPDILFSKKSGIPFKIYWVIISLSRENKVFRLLIDIGALLFYRVFRSDKTFAFNKQKYRYFYHFYNRTIASERVVEIPIARKILEDYKEKNILEVGNVMSHYFPVNHDVLDKYEKGEGVINEDVVSFKSNKKYDLIISVSTMEHVGFSYGEPLEPEKFSRGIANLERNLKSGGKMVVTFSLYYNEYITDLIRSKKSPFQKEYFMKRTSFLNEWRQIDSKKALEKLDYDSYYANSNVLYIGVLQKP